MKRLLKALGILAAIVAFFAVVRWEVFMVAEIAGNYRASIVRDTIAAMKEPNNGR